MRKTLLYIIGITAGMLTSCSDEVVVEKTTDFLNGSEKTPITVVSNISASNPVTRAVDGKFEKDDVLNAYIKHVTVADATANPLQYSDDVTGTGVGPRLANFKVTALTTDHEDDADNWKDHTTTSTLTVTDAAGLYWDDFSNSASDDTDLRTSGHALMVYYGFGYNGSPAYGETDSRISTALTESTGVLGWTVATDQTSGFKTSDLLYAGQQTPVAYAHGTNNTIDGRDRVLTIPYTHAMSKVTIEVICDEGFDEDKDKNFGSAAVKLNQAGTVATVTGPTKSVSKGTTPANINMQKLTPADKNCSFSALMAPTVIKAGETFATIEGIDGNNYTISLTDAALTTATAPANAWSTQLAAYDATSVTPDATAAYVAANGGLTKPGVHYMLTVTIKKQQIKVQATIQDWKAVSAEGVGEILFGNDITDKDGDIADGLKTNGFDLYKSTTTTFGAKATTISWDSENNEWTYSPKIYWQSSSDAEYFRALSGAVADNPATDAVNESLAMSQGSDVLWGTTPAHSGTDVNRNPYNYRKNDPINPRTGNVPLEFEHAMSKISVVLKTSDNEDAKVDLTDAQIDIINIYNEGKIDINTGKISDFILNLTSPIYTLSGTVTKDTDNDYKLLNQIVIPQSLVNDKDGTPREDTPTFYQSGELTKVYTDGTSLPSGGGEGTYYLTSTLDRVNYAASDLTTIYADGTSIDDGSGAATTYETASLLHVDEEQYSQAEIDAAKALVDAVTPEVEATAAAKVDDIKTPAVKHNATAEEAATFNEAHADEITAGTVTSMREGDEVIDTPAVLYTQDDIDAAKEKIAAVTDEVRAVAEKTAGDIKTPEYYKLQDSSIQANVGDLHYYQTNTGSEQHNPGELKSAGNKIMMYITLKNHSRYSIELSNCNVKGETTLITDWLRGEHYTYEITLGKEEITFRALVKDWVEKTGSGDATLDWD